MKNISYIGLGTNIGNRVYYLEEAVRALETHAAIQVNNVSSIYETDPVGYVEQSSFLNMVLEIATTLSPYELLTQLQRIELDLGRKRDIRWGPRTIDLDILLYNQENMETEKLTIPHPRMYDRDFVLVPLRELQGEFTQSPEGVRVWKRKNGGDVLGLFES